MSRFTNVNYTLPGERLVCLDIELWSWLFKPHYLTELAVSTHLYLQLIYKTITVCANIPLVLYLPLMKPHFKTSCMNFIQNINIFWGNLVLSCESCAYTSDCQADVTLPRISGVNH